MRGFDVFMRVAKRIYQAIPDVLFVIVGSDRICYGGDQKHIQHGTFREHVLAQDSYDSNKFIFTGPISQETLVDLLSLSELHVYLTVPFVLSWSLMNALSCGCTVLASSTPPVLEVISDGFNGLLADFFDVDGLATKAIAVLQNPAAYHEIGRRAVDVINDRYSLEVCLPQLVTWLQSCAAKED
jgi:glycosyltransferase involved in cell wall biosynthesis